MSEPREPLRRVVVLGANALGLLAALALRRALPGCEVVAVSLPSDAARAADVAGASGIGLALLERSGITERELLSEAGASHRLVTRLFGFSHPGSHAAFAPGAGTQAAESRFAAEWGRSAPLGGAPPQPPAIAQALADAGRFSADLPVEYAMRWHGDAFRDLLVRKAVVAGIEHVAGPPVIEWGRDGSVAGLALPGGSALGADLFIDCSGSPRLAVEADGSNGGTWQVALPDLRIWHAEDQPPLLALEDRVTRLPQGLLVERPGRDRLATSLIAPPDTDPKHVAEALGGEPVGVETLATGRAAACWRGNIVALGGAGALVLPLLDAPFELACRQLDLLLDMLPGRDPQPREAAEYNRRAAAMADGVLEMQAAFFLQGPHPPRLGATLDQFARHGRIPFREDAALETADFAALLDALGHPRGTPARATPAAPEPDPAPLIASVPRYPDWLRGVLNGG